MDARSLRAGAQSRPLPGRPQLSEPLVRLGPRRLGHGSTALEATGGWSKSPIVLSAARLQQQDRSPHALSAAPALL